MLGALGCVALALTPPTASVRGGATVITVGQAYRAVRIRVRGAGT